MIHDSAVTLRGPRGPVDYAVPTPGHHVPGTSMQPLLDAPHAPLTLADDAVLHDHVDKVQTLFLDMVDRQVTTVLAALDEREMELQQAETDRQHALASLGQAWTEVDRVNKILMALNTKLHSASQNEVLMTMEQEAATKDLRRHEQQNTALAQDVATARHQVGEASKRIEQLRQINVAFTADLKVQKRIQSKLKKEKEILARQRQEAENELATIQKKYEQIAIQNHQLKEKLTEQQNETRVAQNAIGRMSNEISKATKVKEFLERQWEDAMSAMTKRDQTLLDVAKAKDATNEDLIETRNVLQNTTLQNERTQLKLEETEQQADQFRKLYDVTRLELETLRAAHDKKCIDAHQAQTAASQYEQELVEERKTLARLREEVDRQRVQLAQLQANLHDRDRRDQVRANEDFAAQVIQQQTSRTEREVQSKDRSLAQEINGNIELRNENAKLVLEVEALKEQLDSQQREKTLLHSKTGQVTQQAEQLHYENQLLLYRLEKKDMELSSLKLKDAPADLRPLEIVVQNLEKELAAIKKDKDQMQVAWLRTQQSNAQLQEQVKKLQEENDFLETQSTVNTTARTKISNEVKDMKRDTFEQNMHMTKLYVELQRLRPKVRELEERNAILEAQLANCTLDLEESAHNTQTAVHLLKHDVRRIANDKANLVRSRMYDERAFRALEQKFQVTKEVLEKVKADKQALLRQNLDLKAKADAWSAKVVELTNQWKKLDELGGMHVGRRSHAHAAAAAAAVHAGRASAEAGNAEGGVEGVAEYEIVDVPAIKLRNQTLTLENRHLQGEIDLSHQRIAELQDRLVQVEEAHANLTLRVKSLEKTVASQNLTIHALTHRAHRAERIATVLEVQVKDARPNTHIEYDVPDHMDIEPSTTLLAEFLKAIPTPAEGEAAAKPLSLVGMDGVSPRKSMPGTKFGRSSMATLAGLENAPLPPLPGSGGTGKKSGISAAGGLVMRARKLSRK
ncbi:hypothetical protein GGF32_009652 [Allomyces javanicus]|nr:hypothetical protein GGF32_009652 [Allomyces javanicus]